MPHDWIVPDWPAPAKVHAICTTRNGGVSSGTFASLNLADHVGDVAQAVHENRNRLRKALKLPHEPHWLRQVHGSRVIKIDGAAFEQPCDAAYTHREDEACVVMTADCLPLLLCDRDGTTVAAAHAGWRSLVAGVLENTLRALPRPRSQLLAWFGPAIGPETYEVGDEVMLAFVKQDSKAAAAFRRNSNQRWLCDLYVLARLRLNAMGVTQIYGGGLCTFSEPERFFSYRRDGGCGRMATLIWLQT